jgi:hypothetical protein
MRKERRETKQLLLKLAKMDPSQLRNILDQELQTERLNEKEKKWRRVRKVSPGKKATRVKNVNHNR